MMTFHLDIVSLDGAIFSGLVARLFVVGAMGELEITPRHSPLLTKLVPGPVRLRLQDGSSNVVYVSGGLLEVQPDTVTILADTVVRAPDFNKTEALKAKEQAESYLKGNHTSEEYAQARADLTRAAGMLKAIREIQHYN